MRRPKKTQKLYRSIKEDILKRRYLPGECLPKEVDFAETLGCARDTLRKVLAQLEVEQLVSRVRGKGTFVSSNLRRRKISVLLPCAGAIRSYSPFYADQMQGVMEEASRQHCEIEMLPVSPTNDPENIDWTQLFNLNERSLVFFSSFWFLPLFDFLERSKCRVAMLYDESNKVLFNGRHLKNWTLLRINNNSLLKMLIAALVDRGCRRPLFISRFIDNPARGYRSAVLEGCKELLPGVSPKLLPLPQKSISPELIKELLAQAIRERSEYPFDAVILDSQRTFAALRQYAPEMWCGFLNMKQHTQLAADSRTIYSDFNYQTVGAEAVRQLLGVSLRKLDAGFDGKIILPDKK